MRTAADLIRTDQAFFMGAGTQTGGAGTRAHVQLFNPVASGVTLLVIAAWVSTQTTARHSLRHHNAALSTLGGAGASLDIGGAAPAAELRVQSAATELGTLMGQWGMIAGLTVPVRFHRPIVIEPGLGIQFTANAQSVDTVASFLWAER